MPNPDMGNMPDHHPERGDQVEAWLEDRRNQYHSVRKNTQFMVVDDLLKEYRLAADTDESLDEVVNARTSHLSPEEAVRTSKPDRPLKPKGGTHIGRIKP